MLTENLGQTYKRYAGIQMYWITLITQKLVVGIINDLVGELGLIRKIMRSNGKDSMKFHFYRNPAPEHSQQNFSRLNCVHDRFDVI